MVELIKTEFKKLYRNKVLWGFLFLLAIADIYKISHSNQREAVQIDGYEKVYAKVRGKITEEKIRFIIDYYRELEEKISTGNYSTEYNKNRYTGYDFGDYHIVEFFYKELQYAFEYSQEMEQLCKRWERKIELCQKYNMSYRGSAYKKILLNYRKRSISSYYNMSSAEKFLSYDFSTILIIAAIFFAVPSVIFYERKSGMWLFLKTMPDFTIKLMGAKLISVTLFVFLLTVFFGMLDFICFHKFYMIDGLWQPLYSIESYKYTIFGGTVIQFIFLHQTLKYSSFLFFAYTCLLISFFIRDQVITVLLSFTGFVGLIFLCLYSNILINPILFFENQEWMKSYHEIKIFTYPVCQDTILSLFIVFVDLFLVMLIIISVIKWNRPKKDLLHN